MTINSENDPSKVGEGPEWMAFILLSCWILITMLWWALAFVRLPAISPDWLVQGRFACFGTLENGLPDVYGWVTLFFAPFSMLVVMLFIWWGDLGKTLVYFAGRPSGRLILGVMVMVPLLGVTWVSNRTLEGLALTDKLNKPPVESAFPADFVPISRPAPDFQLFDQHARPVSMAALRGRPVFLTFAYGHCEAACPLIVRRVVESAGKMAGVRPAVVIITLDPWRDTPPSLPAIVKIWGFSEEFTLLSGSVEEVNRVLDAYDVRREKNEKTGNIVHSAMVYVISSQGKITYTLNNPSTGWLVEAARRSAEQPPVPEPKAG